MSETRTTTQLAMPRLDQTLNRRFSMLICFVVGSILVTAGCNQSRYKPAKWRTAARSQSTLPTSSETTGNRIRWSSLPTRSGGTLPMRNWGTLPMRNWGTLPNRNWGSLPMRSGSSLPFRTNGTLPGRSNRSFDQNGSSLPQRSGASTLPTRGGIYPEYRMPQRSNSTLPNSYSPWRPKLQSSSTTLPGR